jgi:hypothetical protein
MVSPGFLANPDIRQLISNGSGDLRGLWLMMGIVNRQSS